jgi:hypothetical protein
MNMENQNAFQRFHALGYKRFTPVVPPDAKIYEKSALNRQLGKDKDPRGKSAGVKNGNGEWYGFDFVHYENDELDLDRWHRLGAGVGLKTGDGLVMIDADTTNLEWAAIIVEEVKKLIPLSSVRVGQHPKAGYIVRTDKDFKYTCLPFGDRNDKGAQTERVEILAEGKFFVAHGVHPKTRKPYYWPNGIPAYDDLPFVSSADLLALMERLRARLPAAAPITREGGGTAAASQASLKGDLEKVRKAVRATPNTLSNFPTREDYRNYGYAIKAALQDHAQEALELFEEWCEQWVGPGGEINEPDTIASDWRRMKPPYRRGAAWLYELAEKYSGGAYGLVDVWFDVLPEDTTSLFDTGGREDAKQQAAKFKLLDFDEAADTAITDMAPPLIKGLLDKGTMSVVYGDSNVGKTFVAMDIAYHIATGGRYAGMKTAHALVVYVAMEGGRGARRRLAALRDKFKPEHRPLFKLLSQPVNMRNPEVDMGAFKACLTAIGAPVGLVVIDTLSRAMAGGDENGSVDMGAFIKNVDAVRAVTQAHIMVVHHTGKDKAKGARGHSSLRAATDTELEVAEGVISATKQRDLDKAWSSPFRLEVRTLGVDADGDPVTSCTVRLDSVTAVSRREPTEGEAAVLDAIAVLCETSSRPDKGVRTKDLEAWCKDNLSSMSRDTLNQHLRGLRGKRLVSQETRGYWRPTAVSNGEDLLGDCEENVFS